MFEAYIVSCGAIADDQLQAAFDAQADRTPLVGQVARELGVLSPRQVLSLLDQQQQSTLRFCELAVNEHMMTQRQRARVLAEQQQRRPPLLEMLLETGGVTRADIFELRRMYAKQAHFAPERTGTRLKQLSPEEFSKLARQVANDRIA